MGLLLAMGLLRMLLCAAGCPTAEKYARRMGQPTQRATSYTARPNIDTAQIFLHANGQSAPRIRQRSRRRQRRGEPHTEHGLGDINGRTGGRRKHHLIQDGIITCDGPAPAAALRRRMLHCREIRGGLTRDIYTYMRFYF